MPGYVAEIILMGFFKSRSSRNSCTRQQQSKAKQIIYSKTIPTHPNFPVSQVLQIIYILLLNKDLFVCRFQNKSIIIHMQFFDSTIVVVRLGP